MHKAIGIGLFLVVGTNFPTHAQVLRFQHLTTDHGLSDNAITCVYEDRAGFIWIGTERGLNRYDGSTVQQVVGSEASIAAVLEDRQGTVWAATRDKGLVRLGTRWCGAPLRSKRYAGQFHGQRQTHLAV
ncbi:MAG: hypothetical protein IPG74_02770 [Flavobacteriales bacterium]|nr:hypothetical protein [Flavobacteriales bacterium]